MTKHTFKTNLYSILNQFTDRDRNTLFKEIVQKKLEKSLESYTDDLNFSFRSLANKQSVYALKIILKGVTEVKHE